MTRAGRRVLVVGGAGFVGAAAVRELLAEGWRVAVMDPARREVPEGAEALAGSIEDAAAIRAAIEASQPDAVACFAAYGGSGGGLSRAAEAEADRAFAVNVLGFRRLLAEVAAAGIRRVVWTSSTVVLGAAASEARVDEDAPRLPLGTYALTKVLAEDVADFMRRVHGLEITGLRIPLMLGPGLWYDGAASWVKRLVDEAAPGAAPEITAPGILFDAMHAADLGRLVAQLLAGDAPREPIYHVAGFTTDAATLARDMARIVPGYAPRLRIEAPPVVFPLVDEARLVRDTGFAIRHDAEGVLRDMLANRSRSKVA
ncbi:MAG: nucleoside-diphosphate sugar epimerase [Rubritepida sp.]|nr:nucleoside-diphosphate sugar epimerase [Rubritepida sp.]